MFQTLLPQPPDGLLTLIGLFRDDPRNSKIDLGVGTYRNAAGITPVMEAIKAAERILLDGQQTKGYLGPEGDQRFVERLRPIVFGAADAHAGRLVGVQTPGGSGALRLGGELIATARPGATVWIGTPTWCTVRPSICRALMRLVTMATASMWPRLELTRTRLPLLMPSSSANAAPISTNCSGWMMELSNACLVQ